MINRYDFEKLSRETGFNPVQIEKVCRISDILAEISNVPFMRKRLSLYGGTALAFIHFDAVERLSVDLDFNYRIQDIEDWGEERDTVDANLKVILGKLGYTGDDIRISPSYPLTRFTVRYANHVGRADDIQVETGYMRRFPVLKRDVDYDFYHIGTRNKFKVMSPVKEELFSNKWCTMLYRGSPRDLFDVYKIMGEDFNFETFRVAAIVDSLMRGLPRLTNIDFESVIHSIPFDTSLLNVLYAENDFDEALVQDEVIKFSETVFEGFSCDMKMLVDRFFDDLVFDIDLLEDRGFLHESIQKHPSILWQLRQLGDVS